MQVSPVFSISQTQSFSFNSMYSSSELDEISAKLSEDFGGRLKFDVSEERISEKIVDEESSGSGNCVVEEQETEEHDDKSEDEEGGEEEEEEEEDFEFSFDCANPDGSPISADDIFSEGQIRPVFPIFNRDLLFAGGDDGSSKDSKSRSALRPPLRKLFVEERDLPSSSSSSGAKEENDQEPIGAYCVWSKNAMDASPEVCKKSNSTGFSKRWRFRDLIHRSSSDGKDAFVFLHPSTTSIKPNQSNEKVEKNEMVEKRESSMEMGKSGAGGKVKANRGKGVTVASSAHEKHYVKNRASKEGDRRRSYLPYRQDLVGLGAGFFTNVHGFSRNVHPF